MKIGYLSFLKLERTLLGGKFSKLLHVKNVNLLFPLGAHKLKAAQGSPQWLLGVFFSPFSFLLFKNLSPCDHDNSFRLIFFSFLIPFEQPQSEGTWESWDKKK